MTKPAKKNKKSKGDPSTSGETTYKLGRKFVRTVIKALRAGDAKQVRDLIAPLHPADAADLIEGLNQESRGALIEAIRGDFDPEILSELDETVCDEVVELLGIKDVAAAVAELETDDAVQVVEELDKDEQKQVLDAIPASERTLIEEGLAYPDDSAGRLMQRELVSVPEFWTVGETIDFLRQSAEQDDDALPAAFYDIFVVDPGHRPVGTIPLSRLLRTRRPVKVIEVMERKMKVVPATMDQEDVAFLFSQRDLISAPVVDEGDRLVGAITVDDVVDVIHEEHEEDIMRLGGVSEDDFYSAALDTTRSRFSWLLVNLFTAFLASTVIGYFEATIDQIVALAILMPIVASMGGNAGTQTMTVAVRALAMKELTATNSLRTIFKEVVVATINGILFAAITGVVAWFWFSSSTLGIVIALAMVVNLIVAGLAGASIPLLLERSGADPAIASGVLLTTITDVVGFASFLGLAAWILL